MARRVHVALPNPGKPIAQHVKETSAKIHWYFPDDTSVKSFDVYYKSECEANWQTVAVFNAEVVLEKLRLGTAYEVKVRAVSQNKFGDFSECSEPVKTQEEKLTAPRSPQKQQATEETLTVRWNAPQHGSVTGYKVWYTQDDPSDDRKWWHDSCEETQFTITDLIPDTKYAVKIQARGSIGHGPESELCIMSTEAENVKAPSIPKVT